MTLIISYQMLALTILALCLLTAINYKFAGNTFFTLRSFSVWFWTLDLASLAVPDGVFYLVLPETFVIFLCGVLAFRLDAGSPFCRDNSARSFDRIPGLLEPDHYKQYCFHCSYHRAVLTITAFQNLVGEGDKSPFLLLARAATQEMIGKSAAFPHFDGVF